MEFLPSLDDDSQVIERKGYRVNNKMKLMKMKKPLKLNSMPIVEKKLEGFQQENFELEKEYRLLSILGAGTYSKVHLAERLSDNMQFAIKISRGTTSGSLLEQEYNLLKEVSDPIIPKAIDFRKNWMTNTSYLIMEYFEGKQLDIFIKENGKLSDDKAMKCIKSLCDCITRLHSSGIAHRDIKPQNILINEELSIRLIDFNISKKGKEGSTSSKFSKRFFSQVSSPLFAAPELFSFNCYSESVDIWGVGIILIAMIFGMDVFESKSKLSSKEIYDKFNAEFIHASSFSDEIKNFLTLALAYEAEDRATAFELSRLIE